MHPVTVSLLLATTATWVFGRPYGFGLTPEPKLGVRPRYHPSHFDEIRQLMMPLYVGGNDSPRRPRGPPPVPYNPKIDWLTKEINHLNEVLHYEEIRDMFTPFYQKHVHAIDDLDDDNMMSPEPLYAPPSRPELMPKSPVYIRAPPRNKPTEMPKENNKRDATKTPFAYTPTDKGFYDHREPEASKAPITVQRRVPDQQASYAPIQPRKTRQNPNLSKTKNLVAETLERLKTGRSDEGDETQTETARHIHVLETERMEDPTASIYGVAFMAAVGAALALAIIGFAIGWYTVSKRAKAAADVDYPAYGVTGPSVDTSGDRKLAQSAHMYHYQHQKQQIIAMERNGVERNNGSVSDPESEEENEEGDYTVYECPGFATTGDMEVKNPLFSDDSALAPAPATPGKCELVKPQPKD